MEMQAREMARARQEIEEENICRLIVCICSMCVSVCVYASACAVFFKIYLFW